MQEITFVSQASAQEALAKKGLANEYEVVPITENTKLNTLVDTMGSMVNTTPFYAMMNQLTGYNSGDLFKQAIRSGTRYGIRRKQGT